VKPRIVLLTSFEPFGGRKTNSSDVFLQSIDSGEVFNFSAWTVEKRTLPVSWSQTIVELKQQVAWIKPDLIVSFGEAPSKKMKAEMIAQNTCRTSAVDSDSREGNLEWIDPLEAPLLVSPWKTLKIVERLQQRFDIESSDNAGQFLCNRVLFELVRKDTTLKTQMPSGFFHIPVDFELNFTSFKSLSHHSTHFLNHLLTEIIESKV
jgi:pyroglutamyl-peptidase